MSKATVIKGTPKQIVQLYNVNGMPLDESMVSALCRIGQAAGFAKPVESVRSASGKGKPSTVWELSLPREWNVQYKTVIIPQKGNSP